MSQPPYRALQVALRIFSVLFAVGGLFMIFGNDFYRGIRILLELQRSGSSNL